MNKSLSLIHIWPKVRRVFDKISDFCDKMLVVNYIILFVCSVVIIGVPTHTDNS